MGSFCQRQWGYYELTLKIWEQTFVYYDPDDPNSPCKQGENITDTHCAISFVVTEDIAETVYFYYGLSNFYQNHRLYVRSRDDTQLGGEEGLDYGDLDACDPLISPVR